MKEVKEMLTRKKSMETNRDTTKPESRLLRLFGSSDVFQGSFVSIEARDREVAHVEDQKRIRNVMLESEYQNAKALLAFQNNKRFY